MKVLSIGNSFASDAQRYAHRIARADGFDLTTANLYIGGCPLSRHYRNMLSERDEYILEYNGEVTLFKVSLKEALLNRDWDVVTLQQVSNKAPFYDTYQPYLDELATYVRKCVPKAKLAIHQTWAYEDESKRLTEELGYKCHQDMFRDIEKAYAKASKAIGAEIIIPSGMAFEKLLEAGIEKVHRDTFHAALGIGRYALGLLWYGILSGNDVLGNTFRDLDEPADEERLEIVRKCIAEICRG